MNAQIIPIVVPNQNRNVEGPNNNSIPFGSSSDFRYQQLYSSSQLENCTQILQINFRFDDFSDANSITYPDVLVQLSTTSLLPGELSTTFANNIGPDVTTVYSGELSFEAPECDAGPCPFDNTIILQTPFSYDPSEGNLLLDVAKSSTIDSYNTFDATK